MSPPQFSIVIPLYNRRDLIRETLDSVRRQTFDGWECLVVDDGSTDDSFDVVRNEFALNDDRFRLLKRPSERPKGACACRNLGLEQAIGDFVYFFDSDDLLFPNALEEISRTIKRRPDCDFYRLPFVWFDQDDPTTDVFDRYFEYPPLGLSSDAILRRFRRMKNVYVSTQFFCWKRSFLLNLSFFWPEDLICRQDYLYYYRILVLSDPKGAEVESIPFVRIRRHSGQICRKYLTEPAYAAAHLQATERLYLANRTRKERVFFQARRVLVLKIFEFGREVPSTGDFAAIRREANDFFRRRTTLFERLFVYQKTVFRLAKIVKRRTGSAIRSFFIRGSNR